MGTGCGSSNEHCTDADGDGVCDADDLCDNASDSQDNDDDGVPDACDLCPTGDDAIDQDDDGVPDPCDLCSTGDDAIDQDDDGVPDACDLCSTGDDAIDLDDDGVPDACDDCVAAADAPDTDADGLLDACDPCPTGPNADADENGFADACETVLFSCTHMETGSSSSTGATVLGISFGLSFCANDTSSTDMGVVGRSTEMMTPSLNIFTADNDPQWASFIACATDDRDGLIYTSSFGWFDHENFGSFSSPVGTEAALGINLQKAEILYVRQDARALSITIQSPEIAASGPVDWEVIGFMRP